MEFKNLSNKDLLVLAKENAKDERAKTLVVINIIREVENRRLHLELGYGSLFDFVRIELGYDESAANRRITAARLTRQIPEVENKIFEGKLTLSNLVQAQVFFNKEKKLKNQNVTLEEKREILGLLENKSKREAEKVLLTKSPEQVTLKESTRQITENHSELKIVIDKELEKDLEKLRSLLSHKKPNPTYLDLLKEIAKIALKELDPSEHTPKRGSQSPSKSPPPAAVENAEPVQKRHYSLPIKKAVWGKSEERCTFISPVTGKRCESTYQLEVHHKVPFAMGGHTTEENLTLLCRNHNMLEAIRDYGSAKMETYTQKTFF